MRRKLVVAVALFVSLLARIAPAQSTSDSLRFRHRILGVYDAESGDPIEGVDVVDVLTGTRATTNRSGLVSLAFLPEGTSLVRVQKVGFAMQNLSVSISPKDTLPLTLVFQHATALPALTVTDSAAPRVISPALRAFEERRKQGFGRFITEAELRKNDNRGLSRLIVSRIPGVVAVAKDKSGMETYLAAARKACDGLTFQSQCSANTCLVQVYLDDAILPPKTDINSFRAEDFAGIEFYPGGASMPLKYNRTGSDCGVLLLWTRER